MEEKGIVNDEHTNITANEDGDLILLNGCGYKTEYKFPDQKMCPVLRCDVASESRSALINHYKEEHAQNSIYCFLCCKPIVAEYPYNFIHHFRRKHKNVKDPFDFDEVKQLSQAQNIKDVSIIWLFVYNWQGKSWILSFSLG